MATADDTHTVTITRDHIPVSFDVVSLYTNIDVKEAIETALEYSEKHQINTFGLSATHLQKLLNLLLTNNTFQFDDHFYKQIRGLAMGNRLSGTLAIICMDRFEANHIFRNLTPKPIIYVRYVDDTGTLAKSKKEAENMLEYLNSKHPTIKFEMERPDMEEYLPILDIKLKINDDGSISRKMHVKSANKGIMLNFYSHQLTAMKRSTVLNKQRRADKNSTRDHSREAQVFINKKLRRNGYPNSWQRTTTKTNKKTPKPSYNFVYKSHLYQMHSTEA